MESVIVQSSAARLALGAKFGLNWGMPTLEDLDHRVSALEAAQNDTTQTLRWVVAKLGRISAVQEEHTLRLERIESDVKGLREELPAIVGDAVREAFKETRI